MSLVDSGKNRVLERLDVGEEQFRSEMHDRDVLCDIDSACSRLRSRPRNAVKTDVARVYRKTGVSNRT